VQRHVLNPPARPDVRGHRAPEEGRGSEVAMEEGRIRDYFEHQARLVIERSAAEPEGFLSYFAEHEPKDEEILGLLAVSTMMGGEFHSEVYFPTPSEALAALSGQTRSEICKYFREELAAFLRAVHSA
jgi:hypothetical protein